VTRILVVRVLGLGDLLTGVPALRALRRAHPGADLRLATPHWLGPLLPVVGAVDDIVAVTDLAELGPVDPPPDLTVNLHGRGPQSIAASLRTGGAEIVTHRHADHPGLPGPDWDPAVHERVRWCRLLQWAGMAADPDDLYLGPPPEPPLAAGSVLVHPGASAESRRWPADRFAAVARALGQDGHRVLVTGSVAERPLADRVVAAADDPLVDSVAGRLDLAGLAALTASAALVISGDTGVAHLASGYRTPSVVLFGPTPPALWGPPTPGPHAVLWRGGRGDPHADRPDPGLLAIGVDEVITTARRLIG
jgi:ADP-heptose:LPS heptosyltransferase